MEQTRAKSPSVELPKHVSADEYMRDYAEHFYEWAKGKLIPMSLVSGVHDDFTRYLAMVAEAYFALSPIGILRQAPFVMRVDATESRREPDLQIILNTNPGTLTDTVMNGAADICIEVVSPESIERDYGTKFVEYEAGGVREYWLFDPVRTYAQFRRLNAEGRYEVVEPDADGYYRTPLLPKFALHVPTLWQEEFPDFFTIGETIKRLFNEG